MDNKADNKLCLIIKILSLLTLLISSYLIFFWIKDAYRVFFPVALSDPSLAHDSVYPIIAGLQNIVYLVFGAIILFYLFPFIIAPLVQIILKRPNRVWASIILIGGIIGLSNFSASSIIENTVPILCIINAILTFVYKSKINHKSPENSN